MTFTYSGTSLSTDLAKIRLNIGDTVQQDYSLTDEEIAVAQGQTASVILASILAMEWRLARLADYIAQQAGGQSSSANQKYEQGKETLERLRRRAAMGGMSIYAGGIEEDRIEDAADDADYPQPAFKIGQDDNATTDVEDEDD